MKRKPIRINWEELESAFDNPTEDLVYYLDLVNGHVVLEGEGEGEGEEDDFDADDERLSVQEADALLLQDNTRAYVDPLTTETKVGWVRRFVEETEDLDPSWTDRLRRALDADDPTPAIIEALARDPEAKERWYLYRTERLHEMIEEWLERHGVTPVEPPPWR